MGGQAIDSLSFANYALNNDRTQGLRESLGIWNFIKGHHQAIRKGEMKLVYANNNFELYNLTEDISETKDLSKDNNYLVHQMFEELKSISPLEVNSSKYFQLRRKTFPYEKNEIGT